MLSHSIVHDHLLLPLSKQGLRQSRSRQVLFLANLMLYIGGCMSEAVYIRLFINELTRVEDTSTQIPLIHQVDKLTIVSIVFSRLNVSIITPFDVLVLC